MSYEGDYAPLLMRDFTRASGLTVQVQSLPWTAAHQKLLTASAGGVLPDVMMLPTNWVGEFAMVGAIRPLPETTMLAGLIPGSTETTKVFGESYAIPWSLAPQMQFFRRDILEEAGYAAPPSQWLAWREMGRRIKRQRPGEHVFLMLLSWWDTLFTFAGQNGAWPLKDSDTRADFQTPAFREALAFYVSLFDEGLAPRLLSTEVQDPLAAFAQGLFAIYPGPPTLLLDLHRRRAEIAADRWGAAMMPGPNGPGPVTSTSACIAVSASTQRPAAAWTLARQLTSSSSELAFQRMIGTLPARIDAWTSAQMSTPLLRPFAQQVALPARTPNIVEWEHIRLEVQIVAERLVRRTIGFEEALTIMNARVDRLLERRRALVGSGRLS